MPTLNLPTPPEGSRPRRRLPGGPRLETLTLDLMTVTPILGGGVIGGELCELEPIRVPTLRGHLRFWWRALYGHACIWNDEESRRAFACEERKLWGGMGQGKEKPQRSQVELRVLAVQNASEDPSNIDLKADPAYALWPARAPKDARPKSRWKPGLRFTLELTAPEGEPLLQASNALRAWLLFSGYGSRTRRGCGSVTVARPEHRSRWLPTSATRADLRRLFGNLPLFEPEHASTGHDLPLLRGAHLYRRPLQSSGYGNAQDAWLEALRWLRDFRQGTRGEQGERARNPDPDGGDRHARSNWPEADKIRHHASPANPRDSQAYPDIHAPRPEYPPAPAWPRAGFGLPIVFHFQPETRIKGVFYTPAEPQRVQLQWVQVAEEEQRGRRASRLVIKAEHDRLASPLIVKALPLANGRFEPIALWLERGYPQDGCVVMVQNKHPDGSTLAKFDQLRAEGDRPLFNPLKQARTLREAFLGWLKETKRATED